MSTLPTSEQIMTAEPDDGVTIPDAAPEAAEPAPARVADLERALEAILMVVDEPQSIVTLASAITAPVPAVRAAIEQLVADYDGTGSDGTGSDGTGSDGSGGGVRRGFELREVGGGWRIYV